jgi:hypothetical protein
MSCDGPLSFRIDCPNLTPSAPIPTGPSCIESGGEALCAVGPCQGESGACEGDTIVRCRNGVEQRRDCRASGLTCGLLAGATDPRCVGDGGPCMGQDGIECGNDGMLIACVNGRISRVDCSTYGLGCFTVSGVSFCGLGDECLPNKGNEVCAGEVLHFCAAGVRASFDCVAAGFLGCGRRGCRAFDVPEPPPPPPPSDGGVSPEPCGAAPMACGGSAGGPPGTPQQCSCQKSCEGSNYQLECTSENGGEWKCRCLKDGLPVAEGSVVTNATCGPAWSSVCNFP